MAQASTVFYKQCSYLVADTDRQWAVAPAAVDSVYITAADTTGVNGNVDIAVLKWLELELCQRGQ